MGTPASAVALNPPWLRDPLWTKAQAVPAMDMDIAGTESFIDKISGRELMTHTRASTATTIGKSNYTPDVRVNLLTWSEQFNNVVWTGAASTVVANAAVAPDGATTADKLIINNGASGFDALIQSFGIAPSSTFTISGFFKAAEYSAVRLQSSSSNNGFLVTYNLSTGALIAQGPLGTGSLLGYGIQAFPNGWYRIWATGTILAGVTSAPWRIQVSDLSGNAVTGNGTNGILVWGAQAEPGTTASTYLPTLNVGRTTGPWGTVEQARVNLLLRSEEFDNASWTKSGGSVSANAIAGPYGATTADAFVDTAVSEVHRVTQTFTANVGVPYCFSCYCKKGVNDFIQIAFGPNASWGGVGSGAFFNLNTGAVNSATNAIATIEPIGDGWYRCIVIASPTVSGTSNANITATANGSTLTYLGTGGVTTYLWGAQVEPFDNAGPYIPTTSAIVGRPRLRYNPVTLQCEGLWAEEQRTNLLLWSDAFDNAAWGRTGIQAFGSGSVANTIAAPDGSFTADLLVENTLAGIHHASQTFNTTVGTVYTVSCFAKLYSATRRLALVVPSNNFGVTPNAIFNLATGVVASVGNGTATIQAFGDGWYRCTLTTVAATVSGSNGVNIRLEDGTTTSYTGDGVSGVYLWGAQLEAGANASSYIPTFASQVTRLADVPVMTGDNFTSWYGEESRTNSIRNNTMVGAVAGMPGTLPTNWATSTAGLTRTVVGTGVSNGVNWIDIRLAGTTSSTFANINFDAIGAIGAANGTTWTHTCHTAIVGGSTANITGIRVRAAIYDSGNAYLGEIVASPTDLTPSLTSALTRSPATTGMISNASVSSIVPSLQLAFSSGAAIDITIRIGMPQLELGAFATSVIPTYGSAVTRPSTVAPGMTAYAECVPLLPSGIGIWGFDDTTSSKRWRLGHSGTSSGGVVVVDTTVQANMNTPANSFPLGGSGKVAGVFRTDDVSAAANGIITTAPDTSATLPSVSQSTIGFANSAGYVNGPIARLTFWRQRLSDPRFVAITTP